MTEEQLREWEEMARAARPQDEYSKDRVGLDANAHSINRSDASVWYPDGDLCAAVHGNLALGCEGLAYARLFAIAPKK